MASKAGRVKSLFEEPRWYLDRRQHDIRVRSETVQEFVRRRQFSSVLDIGAGDGSISLQFLRSETRLTLLDFSSRMLVMAGARVPAGLSGNIEMINEDFMATKFAPHSFDLILCLGVLAYVDSPSDFAARIVSLLKPGGSLVVAFSDSYHLMERLRAGINKLWSLAKTRTYPFPLNVLSGPGVRDLFCSLGLKVGGRFRYCAALPGMHRVFAQSTLYRMIRAAFGNSERNRNSWLGSDYIFLFLSPSE